jgi:hypothetical protein
MSESVRTHSESTETRLPLKQDVRVQKRPGFVLLRFFLLKAMFPTLPTPEPSLLAPVQCCFCPYFSLKLLIILSFFAGTVDQPFFFC